MSDHEYTVYKHTTPCGKVYIGITSKKPCKRWNGGLGYLNNDHFYRAILKYGWDNIQHEILFTHLTKEEAEKTEIELIALYRSDQKEYGYNIQHGGSSNGKHADETKEKISKANKGRMPWIYGGHHSEETKKKISDFHKGSHLPENTRKKISESLKGKKQSPETVRKRTEANRGRVVSEETRKKISEANKGRKVVQSLETRKKISKTLSTPVLCIETGVVYCGAREASRQMGLQSSSISRCCNGKIRQTGGFHWKYINKE